MSEGWIFKKVDFRLNLFQNNSNDFHGLFSVKDATSMFP